MDGMESIVAKAILSGDSSTALEQLNTLSPEDAESAKLLNATNDDGQTLYHLAAQKMPENNDVFKSLVKKGVDPSVRDNKGVSGFEALIASSLEKGAEYAREGIIKPVLETGDISRLEMLAKNGCMVAETIPPKEEQEKMMANLSEEVVSKLHELIDMQAKQSNLSMTICENDTETPLTAEKIKELGSFACGLTRDGLTLLHQAVICENLQAVEMILAEIPDIVNAIDYLRRTPLHLASMLKPSTEICDILKGAGSNESLKDAMNRTTSDYNDMTTDELQNSLAVEKGRLQQIIAMGKANKPATTDKKAEDTTEQSPKEDNPAADNAESNAHTETEAKKIVTPVTHVPQSGLKPIKPVAMYVSGRDPKKTPPAPAPCTADGRYIAQNLGEALTQAMVEIAQVRPWDPIEYLARWLYKYRRDHAFTLKQAELLKSIREEEARLTHEQEEKFKRMEELKRYQEEEAEKRRLEEEDRKRKEQEELLRSTKESNLAQKPALPTVNEEGEEGAGNEDGEDDGEEDDDPPVKDRDAQGQTELHKLASQQGIDFKALIELGYSIADRDIHGKTARDVALTSGQRENVQAIDYYVKKLLEDGREDVLEQLVLDGFTGFEDTSKEGLPEVTITCLNRLSNLKESILSTMRCASHQDTESQTEAQEALNTQPLLAKAKDNGGRTLLHIAVLAGADKLATHLMTEFSDMLKARDNCNRTALHFAYGASPDLVDLLISKGSSPKARDTMKRKPAYYKSNPAEIKNIQIALGIGSGSPANLPEVSIADADVTNTTNTSELTEGLEEQTEVLATVVGGEQEG